MLLEMHIHREDRNVAGNPPAFTERFTDPSSLNTQSLCQGRIAHHFWYRIRSLRVADWDRDLLEANAMWQGFLASPRIYQPLLTSFKQQFLRSASHSQDLGQLGRQFATFLTYAALGLLDDYAIGDWRGAFSALPQDGLNTAAWALEQVLEGAAEQREAYWKNRILPFWQNIWPKSRDRATPVLSETLARITIGAGTEFPVALNAFQHWLKPIDHPYSVIHHLHESGLCDLFPLDSLQLLASIVGDHTWGTPELEQCLDRIVRADTNLGGDVNFQRLRTLARRQSGSS